MTRRLTKSNILSEVVMTKVIIKSVVPRPWAHLLGTIGDAVQFSPTPFYTFPIRSTDTGFQIQRMG